MFIRLAAVRSAKSREIPKEFKLIAGQVHTKPTTLMSIKRAYAICDFLLVINSNFRHISYRFQDIDV